MADAEKREKVIRGLMACNRQSYNGSDCQNCPYYDDEDTAELPLGICNIQDMFDDALALLREQEPRVMMLDEARETLHTADFLYCEDKNDDTMPGGLMRCVRDINDYWDYWDLPNGEYLTPDCLDVGEDLASEYGKTFRFWTSRPSPEQMRETKWEGDES